MHCVGNPIVLQQSSVCQWMCGQPSRGLHHTSAVTVCGHPLGFHFVPQTATPFCLTKRGTFGEGEYTLDEVLLFQEIRALWHQLSNLGAIYEEVCREWFLPTYLGAVTSS